MSLLKPVTKKPINPEVLIAQRLRALPVQILIQMSDAWLQGFNAVWNSPHADSAKILEELGPDAGELMKHSSDLVSFILSTIGDNLPDLKKKILETLAKKPATTTHPDGRVTID